MRHGALGGKLSSQSRSCHSTGCAAKPGVSQKERRAARLLRMIERFSDRGWNDHRHSFLVHCVIMNCLFHDMPLGMYFPVYTRIGLDLLFAIDGRGRRLERLRLGCSILEHHSDVSQTILSAFFLRILQRANVFDGNLAITSR